MADNQQLEILIKIREDLEGLRKTQAEFKAAKEQAGLLGNTLNQTAGSSQNLTRANMLLSSAMSGNLTGAIGVVRSSLIGMLGPVGLVLGAVTTLALKLHETFRENEAAQAARDADTFAFALTRARENADDLAKASVDAFAAALTKARAYYDETNTALERQFASMEKIARAKLSLEQTKIRSDPTLTAEQKILAEQKLINEHEAVTLRQKGDLLAQQKNLAEQAKALADRELEAARIARDAAKEKPREAWINVDEIAKLEKLKTELEEKISQNKGALYMHTLAAQAGDKGPLSSDQRDAMRKENEEMSKQLAQAKLQLAHERDSKTADDARAREIKLREDNLSTAEASAKGTAAALTVANQKLQEFNETEKQVAKTAEEERNIRAQAATSDTRLKTAKQLASEEERRVTRLNQAAAISERDRMDALRFEREQANKNPELTRQQRQDIINTLLVKERSLLDEMIERRTKLLALSTDPADKAALEAEIARLKEQLKTVGAGTPPIQRRVTQIEDAYNTRNDRTANPDAMSITEGIGAGAMSWITEMGTAGEQAADLIRNSLGTAVREIGDDIYDWVTGADNFGESIANICNTILRELINQVVQMGVQWVVSGGLAKTTMTAVSSLGSVLRKKEAAETITTEGSKTAVLSTNAALSSASSFGVSAVLGLAALLALMAVFGGFREQGGSVTAGRAYVVGEKRPEIFVPDSNGRILPDAMRFADTGYDGTSVSRPATGATGTSSTQQPQNITNRYFLDWESARRDILTSGDFHATVTDITREFFRMNS